jgi:hypothetical protein
VLHSLPSPEPDLRTARDLVDEIQHGMNTLVRVSECTADAGYAGSGVGAATGPKASRSDRPSQAGGSPAQCGIEVNVSFRDC